MSTAGRCAAPPTDTPTRFPLGALMILALTGFVLVAMETMPAGLLPEIATDMGIGEGTVGLFVSAYALGTIIVTVPAITLTRRFRRRPLLLVGIAGLALSNTVTALSTEVTVALVSRFAAGSFSGMLWGMLAAYGLRISPPDRAGRAIAIVSTGAPLGFAFGTPLGAWVGTHHGWQWAFAALTGVAVLSAALSLALVPDAGPQPPTAQLPLRRVLVLPGIPVVLAVICAWMLAHSTIYTYIAPYLRIGGTGLTADLTLLVYGIASVVGVGITGALMDRHPRTLLHSSVGLFVVAGLILILGHTSSAAVVLAATLWGITFGGASAQLQRAITLVGGDNSDIANSFLPVAFNVAIFGAGILGAGLLGAFDATVLPVAMTILGLIALLLTFYGRRTAFEAGAADR